MKKVIFAAFALALPALASAQAQLMSGYNFGQFVQEGYPALDGGTFDPVGSIGANWKVGSIPPTSSSGDQVAGVGGAGNYSNGSGRLYFDGSNGSTRYNLTGGVEISLLAGTANSINAASASFGSIGVQGDNQNLRLTTNLAGGQLAFVQDTSGYTDYTPAGTLDANFSFAASVTAPVTVNWFLNGSGISFASTSLTGSSFAAYQVDLPSGFYGLSAANLVGQFTGAATLDNVQFNGLLQPIPEPSTWAAILAAATMGLLALRRRQESAA